MQNYSEYSSFPQNKSFHVQHKMKMVQFRFLLLVLFFSVETYFFSENHVVKKFFSRDYRECSEGMILFKKLSSQEKRELVPYCLARLQNSDDWNRTRAALLFCLISPKEEQFVPIMGRLIQDPSEKVRGYAILFLGNLGGGAKSTIPALDIASKTDKSLYVRQNALDSLKKIRN